MSNDTHEGKILILATESCAYPGANSVGQAHSTYPANTFILRVRAPVLFPERFYLDCFRKGISGIIIMSCGEECPYEGAYHAFAKRIDNVFQLMKQHYGRYTPEMVSKVTVKHNRYTNILMGTVQAAIANGVLDAVRAGDIPKEKANDLGIIVSVWLNPSVAADDNLDHKILFDIHRKAMSTAIRKAMNNQPDIDWLLENQDKITHKYFQMGLDGKI